MKDKRQTKEPSNLRGAVIVSSDQFKDFIASGYTTLDKCPEVVTACHEIAKLIASMTIRLMANTENGDIRIKNELSRKVDIEPHKYMTRHTWMSAIVMNLLLYGKGNSIVLPRTVNGYLESLTPVDPDTVTFVNETNDSYMISINGKIMDPSEVLHFVLNPNKHYPWKGNGLTTLAKNVAENLSQASKTTQAFMSSKYKPSMVIKVDGLIDEFSGPEGRRKLLEDYIHTTNADEPWMIPAGLMEIEQVKPLSLSDLAISDTVTLDKKTVASIVGVPSFVLGVGEYNADEWNHFINDTIHEVAQIIQQEMTKKLLINPNWYWEFSMHSLHAYNLREQAEVYGNILYTRGLVTGNEVRSRLSMEPKEDLDSLVVLENYIPLDRIGDQAKLKGDE